MTKQPSVSRDINAANRAVLALSLRKQKLTYAEIALQCGYSDAGAAHKAVQREMSRVVVENVNELRQEELLMLDTLQAMIWPHLVLQPDVPNDDDDDDKPARKKRKKPGINLFAIDRILQISERRCKLMGLDMPVGDTLGNVVVVREAPVGYLGIEGPKA